MKPMTSIIILSYNAKDYTKMCIQSIRQYTDPGTYEIIVVDNGSSDGSLNWLIAQPDIRLIANKENVGFPKGCNQGLQIAAGTDLLLLNNDTIVTPRWLKQLTTALYSSPEIGAVGCMTNRCKMPQRVDLPNTSSISGMIKFSENFNHSNPSKWYKALTLMGFCYLFRREVYERIGELDEAFSPGNFEDDDYSLRIRKAGWKLMLLKDTFIYHFSGVSFLGKEQSEDIQNKKKSDYLSLLEQNGSLFLAKWNLSPTYGDIYKWITQLDIPLQAPHHLFLHGRVSWEPYLLLQRYPQATISFIMDNKGDADVMSCDFDTKYCKDIEQETIPLLEGKRYDRIVCCEPIERYHAPSALLQRLAHHLNTQGEVLYMSSDGVFSYHLSANPST